MKARGERPRARRVFLHSETDLHRVATWVVFGSDEPLFPPFGLRVSCVGIGTLDVRLLDVLVAVGETPCNDPMRPSRDGRIPYHRWLADKRLRESILAGHTVIAPPTRVQVVLYPKRGLELPRHVVGCMTAWVQR